MPEIQTTPIERSRTDDQRFYLLGKAAYERLATELDAANGYPKGVGTKALTQRAIPLWGDVEKSATGKALLCYPDRGERGPFEGVKAAELTWAERVELKRVEAEAKEDLMR